MAERKKNLRNKLSLYSQAGDYNKLSEILPLTTPLSIAIDVSNVCNFKCIFCPTGDERLLKKFRRPKGVMSLGLFCKLIDDIGRFDKRLKKLFLYKDGEPLLNKDIGAMVSYAKDKKVSEQIEIATNGSLLNEANALKMIDSGLDIIKVSVEHISCDGYKRMTGTYFDYYHIRKNVEFLFKEKIKRISNLKIFTKILDSGLSTDEKEKFIDDFSSISDEINIENMMGWSLSGVKDFRLGSSANKSMDGCNILKKERRVCPEPSR